MDKKYYITNRGRLMQERVTRYVKKLIEKKNLVESMQLSYKDKNSHVVAIIIDDDPLEVKKGNIGGIIC